MPPVPTMPHHENDQHDGSSGLLSGIDCSGAMDLFTGMPKVNHRVEWNERLYPSNLCLM